MKGHMKNEEIIKSMKPGETKRIIGKNIRSLTVRASKIGIDCNQKYVTYNDDTGFYIWRVR